MSSKIPFVKAHGLGNDFVIVEALDLPHPTVPQVQWLANRRFGIGCDQVIVYKRQDAGVIDVRFFNADGSEAESCGNGSRAIANLLLAQHPDNAEIVLHTKGGRVPARKLGLDFIEIRLPEPEFIRNPLHTIKQVPGQITSYTCVNIGNPHLVCFVADLASVDVAHFGALLEIHPLFPDRINVSFAQIRNPTSIDLKVWERGVGLTQACGTAACAVAVAAIDGHLCENEVSVMQPGGCISVSWDAHGPIRQQGPATTVFTGWLEKLA